MFAPVNRVRRGTDDSKQRVLPVLAQLPSPPQNLMLGPTLFDYYKYQYPTR